MKSASMAPSAATVLHQERRFLRVRYRGGGGITGDSGSNGSETSNSTQTIIIIVVCATAVVLLVVGCGFWKWMSKQKAQNSNWRFQDYFKRKKIPAAEKSESMLHEARVHAEDGVAHDNTRVPNLGSKSRNQAAASREP